jgi:HEAT repeat protein
MTEEPDGIGAKPGVVAAVVDIMKREGGARGPGGDVLGSPMFLKAGSNRESVPLLLALMEEKDEGVRTGAGEALGKVGDKAAVPRLIQAMKSDTAQMRRVAIGAIALIADISGEAALTEALNNPDDDNEARAQATAGLGKIATPTAIATLVKSLSDDDLKIRSSAMASLARAGRPTPESAPNAQVVAALNTALRAENEATRRGAAEALQIIATPEANASLLAVLQDARQSASVRAAAAYALGFKGNQAAVAALIQALKDEASDVNDAARDALAAIGSGATDALVEVFKQDATAAYLAAQALAKQGKPALPALEKVAQAADPMQQRWAAVALGALGLAEARPALEQLAKNTDPDVAAVAQEQLNRFGR